MKNPHNHQQIADYGIKKVVTIRIREAILAKLIEEFGSIQKFIDQVIDDLIDDGNSNEK